MRTEDSGLVAAQTLVPAKKSQAAPEAPDCCQGFSGVVLFLSFFFFFLGGTLKSQLGL